MTTALTLYGIQTASTTLSTANQLVTSTGGTQNLTKTTLLGNQTGYIEVWSQGDASSQTTGGSVGSASGHGWLYDTTVLEGQDIIAGNWQFIVTCTKANATGTVTSDLIVALYKRSSAGVYTSIGTITLTGQGITGTATAFTSATASLPKMSFATGDKLYVARWNNVTAGSLTSTTTLNEGQSSTANGVANNLQIITPGYTPTATTSTRTVPTSAALLGTNTRTVPTSAALLATRTRTVPTSAALLATNSRTVPTTASLLAITFTRTVPTSAALLATRTRTVPMSASLSKQDFSPYRSLILTRLNFLSPSLIRTAIPSVSWWCPSGVTGTYDFTNANMQELYIVLDNAQQQGYTVILAVNATTPFTTRSSGWCTALADLLSHLIFGMGYTCIQYVSGLSEPDTQ